LPTSAKTPLQTPAKPPRTKRKTPDVKAPFLRRSPARRAAKNPRRSRGRNRKRERD
jgi:hypothetical protein